MSNISVAFSTCESVRIKRKIQVFSLSVRQWVGPLVRPSRVFFLSRNLSQKVIQLPSMSLPNVRDYWQACPPRFY